jgi:hypothetical protein
LRTVLDDFYDAVAMKHKTISPVRLISPGMPDAESNRIQAKRLRSEYLAEQLHRLIDRLKKPLITSVVEVQMLIDLKHSVHTQRPH